VRLPKVWAGVPAQRVFHRAPASLGALLDTALLRQLELLTLDSLAAAMSVLEGEHAGAVRAQFAEPTDYRSYQSGDDPRLIDWNAYARLDELFVRTSDAHEGLVLTLLVDCSRSMAVPWPGKLWHAKRLAAAFGVVALLHSDAVRVCAVADGTARPLPVLSGRTAVGRLLDELECLPEGGGTHLADGVRAGRLDGAGPGFAVLITDLLADESDVFAAVDLFGPSGTILHVVDPADADPLPGAPHGSAIELRDAETGEVVAATLTPALRRRYRELFEARCAELSSRCARVGVHYVRADTTKPVTDLLFGSGQAALTAAGPLAGSPPGR
jgi:uncharacterized protein (DUF58 family)